MTGFGIVAGGWAVVNWGKMALIVASWFTSPLTGAVIGFLTFKFVAGFHHRRRASGHPNPSSRSPPGVLTVALIVLVTVFKGLKNLKLDLSFVQASGIAAVVAGVAALAAFFVIGRFGGRADMASRDDQIIFTEKVFRYLQIMTAATVAFAHGSNDVANAVGPLAGIVTVLREGTVAAKAPVPFWILVLGGIGIVLGLATWGYKVILTIGTKITELTPTRGFAAEFAAAATILVGSRLGMPLSTTHVLVGSVLGVGLARGMAALNLGIVRTILSSWFLTVPLTAIVAVVIFVILRALVGSSLTF